MLAVSMDRLYYIPAVAETNPSPLQVSDQGKYRLPLLAILQPAQGSRPAPASCFVPGLWSGVYRH